MANSFAPSMPAGSGDAGTPSRRRPRFAARRRVLILFVVLVLGGVAAVANYGPVQAYRDARARLDEATSAVSALEEQKTELRSQLGKLSEAGYLESLARQELSYTRPGEELYIVTGLEEAVAGEGTESNATSEAGAAGAAEDASAAGDGDAAEGAVTEGADQPGLFERALSALLGLF